ncbi:hypothetical protein KP509_06G030900 [Ceratopteris richardii]|uniref:Uncharacterized protein n=1 Tax=Ceratopteris richardii TaxID=49495 RepID=A0A8T2ULE7_CERRI|nr:hypothetical protein KP509_06G030900 [Ceratopteris richardii]
MVISWPHFLYSQFRPREALAKVKITHPNPQQMCADEPSLLHLKRHSSSPPRYYQQLFV